MKRKFTTTYLSGCALACILFVTATSTHGQTSGTDAALSRSGSMALLQSGRAPNNTFQQSSIQSMRSMSVALSGTPECVFHLGISTAQGSDLSPIYIPATSYYSPYVLTMDQIAYGDPSLLYNGGFRAPSDGWYFISGRAVFDNMASTGYLALLLTINGVTYTTTLTLQPMIAGQSNHLNGDRIVRLNANDVVKLSVKNMNAPSGYQATMPPNSEWGRDWHTTLSGFRLPDAP